MSCVFEELRQLEHEAEQQRDQNVADACRRTLYSLAYGGRPGPCEIDLITTFIGRRTAQNRYGQ